MFVVSMWSLLGVASLYAGNDADEALKKLMDGNQRFVSDRPAAKNLGDTRRKELIKGQHPFAVVLSCSDSRVPPEHLFDQGLGDIFVVRTAGNIIDKVSIGSIEYGVEHLHVPLLVILGHQKCGAVTAAVESYGKPQKAEKGHVKDSISEIVNKIMPAVKQAKNSAHPGDVLENAIQGNMRNVYSELLKKSPVVKESVRSGKLKVVLAEYYLESGEVKILEKASE